MAENFLRGGAAINALCGAFGIDLWIVDAGCAGGPFPPHALLIDRRVGDGTRDFTSGPAMSLEECQKALLDGFELGLEAAASHACLCFGEMGIANSTSAADLFCAFLGLAPGEAAGPGAGANAEMLAHKKAVIGEALARHAEAVASGDPLMILAALGGFEIAMLAGAMLSCAASAKPFLVDGYICCAAYATASRIYPPISGYAFFSHQSAEPAFSLILSKLPGRPKPLLNLSMRLGEGTGCALALPILRGACAVFNKMATLEEAMVSAKEEDRLD